MAGIRAYIGNFKVLAAQRFAAKLAAAVETLAEHPDRGRRVGEGMRELTIVRPYIIRYRIEGDAVFILRIRHGARRPD